jgi:hypothetical protein
MHALPTRLTRAVLRTAKALLTSTRFGRNLPSDLNNTQVFTSLLAHERMLADRVRVDAYHAAITRHVQPGDTIIDVGTGTGTGTGHPRAVRCATAAAQGHRAGPFRLHRHGRVGSRAQPGRRGRVRPLQQPQPHAAAAGRPDHPRADRRRAVRVDFGVLRDDPDAARYRPADYDRCLLEPGAVAFLLCDAQPVLRVDIDRMTSPDDLQREVSVTRTVTRAGDMDGFVVCFRVAFDDNPTFDTSPLGPLTHWRWRLFRTPRQYRPAGTKIAFDFAMLDPADIRSWTRRLNDEGAGPAAAGGAPHPRGA